MKRERKSGRNQSQLLRAIESLESRLLLSATRYVDLNSPGPTHDGTSWDSAYVDLQEALAAATAGDEIHVADGTYRPTAGTDRTISFTLKTGVSLLGGYAGSGAPDPNLRDIAANVTVLSGNIGTIGSKIDNSYHVVYAVSMTATAVLDGFTITAGSSNSSGSGKDRGGGMVNASSSPTLINCTFSGNSANFYGGGMYNSSSSSPTLINCTFSGNTAGYGAGVYNYYSSPNLTNCTFSGNSAASGGGVYNYSSSPALINCTFSGNAADSGGGGLYNDSYASPKLTNCIVWASGSSPIYSYSGTPVITFSDIEGGYIGTGNIDADPLFVRSPWPGLDGKFGTADDDYGDLRLRPGSPVLDIGSNAAVPTGITTDLAGNPRIQNGTVDMGAYEGTCSAPPPKTLYVDLSAVGTNVGSSWANAFVTLQSALLTAVEGDTVRVADGTYKPTSSTDRNISFQLKNGVRFQGGYAGYGAADPDDRDIAANATILSGDIGTAGNNTDNSYHVLLGTGTSATAVLDGFAITAGNANGSNPPTNYGGGMYNSGGSPTLINCTFISNSATNGSGGGMYNVFSSPTLTNCTFSGNSATSGGGMYNSSSSAVLTNCTFSGNSASAWGGGMYSNSSSSPRLSNCTFIGNSAGSGGGMFNNNSSSPALINSTFSGNSATYEGGGTYNGASSPKLTNCIIWGNGSSSIYNSSSTPVVTYSDIQGGYSGAGNINADPLFVRSPGTGPDGALGTADDDNGDLRLRPGSSVLDIGSNAAVPPGITTDLAGNPRIQNGTVDMGAYEGPTPVPASKTLYVDVSAAGSNTGTSWEHAFVSLQSALLTAVDGDSIRVADGTYRPTSGTDRTISFVLKSGVRLSGGYAGYGASDPDSRDTAANVTVLSGDLGTVGNNADNSYHVVVGSLTTATAVLDGFTITAGNANGGSSSAYGGGMYNYSSSPSLINCIFSGNSASSGGGMYSVSSSAPALTDCTFTGNVASGTGDSNGGGGLYNSYSSPSLINCTFSGNSASNTSSAGGGMYNYYHSSPTLANCTFSDNSAGYGGGMFNYESSPPSLTNCTFSGNSAGSFGGGMGNGSYSSPSLTNCTFSGNSAGIYGAGMYNNNRSSPRLTNCTFSGNSAGYGGGMFNTYSSSPSLINCTFSGNWARYASGGAIYNSYSASPALTNCIIWGDGSSPIRNNSSTPIITYSDIQGGYTGTGNIDADPLFVRSPSPGPDTVWGTADDDYGDLRLRIGSPCIDAGSNAAVPAGITTDLAGNPRFIDVPGVRDPGAIVDIGAYEYTLPLAAAGSAFLLNAAKPSVKISFNGDVSAITLSAGDLLLENLTSGQPIDCSVVATVAYDPATRSATWSFAGLLADGNYRATLPAASVSDAGGNSLASDYSFEFFALAGDANHDRTVDISDLGILATNWQGSAKTFAQGDFNYDGIVDISDLGILATSWQKALPAPSQPAARLRSPVQVRSPLAPPRLIVDKTRRSLAKDILN